jgi:DNA-binding MarR family transcriptional regulator
VIDRLEHAGLVTRQLHARDRRINRVVLTSHGRDLQVPLDRAMDETNLSFVESLPPEDAAQLEALLKTLTRIATN